MISVMCVRCKEDVPSVSSIVICGAGFKKEYSVCDSCLTVIEKSIKAESPAASAEKGKSLTAMELAELLGVSRYTVARATKEAGGIEGWAPITVNRRVRYIPEG